MIPLLLFLFLSQLDYAGATKSLVYEKERERERERDYYLINNDSTMNRISDRKARRYIYIFIYVT